MNRSRSLLSRIFSRQADKGEQLSSAKDRARQDYHAVKIQYAEDACDSIKALSGKIYLSAEAPPLPLTVCEAPDRCSCTYLHFEDRRQGNRRIDADQESADLGHGALMEDPSVNERRTKGRRAEDRPREETAKNYYEYVKKNGD